jgi:pSer/pThr/pTyr-binding forkhead associated (FHA) protein
MAHQSLDAGRERTRQVPQAELRVVSGKQSGSSVALPSGKFLIGREHDCHLRPNSDSISRHHCVFTVDEYSVRLRDLGSTNGTFVNGERLRGAVELKAGDRVTVGKLDFQVVIDGEPSAIIAPGTVVASGTETLSAVAAAPASDNSTEFAVVTPAAAAAAANNPDTAMINTGDSVEFAPATVSQTREFAMPVAPEGAPQFAPQQPWGAPPAGMPPQYGYPPGYPPQYPPMPYGYGYPYPGVPQPMPPGYGYPQPMAPPQAPAVPDAGTKKPDVETRLPDPTTTGAKAPEPKPDAPAAGGAPAGANKHVPSAAKDIINSYLQRKPKT